MKLPEIVVQNTLVDYPRFEILRDMVLHTSHLSGDLAEVGVYKGGMAHFLCLEARGKHVYLFDTFEGMPETCHLDIHKKGDFADTSIKHVQEVLSGMTNYSIYKGIFPHENAEYVEFKKFRLVHLDVDIYDSVCFCLDFFASRMVEGGVIVLDDYNEPNCPGAKLATDRWCRLNDQKVIPTVQSQAYIQF